MFHTGDAGLFPINSGSSSGTLAFSRLLYGAFRRSHVQTGLHCFWLLLSAGKKYLLIPAHNKHCRFVGPNIHLKTCTDVQYMCVCYVGGGWLSGYTRMQWCEWWGGCGSWAALWAGISEACRNEPVHCFCEGINACLCLFGRKLFVWVCSFH